MRQIAFLAAAALTMLAAPAMAQEAMCFQNDQYLVIAQERVGDVGTDILVRPPAKGKIACVYDQQPGDMVIGEPGDPLYYEGLSGQYLVLTRSTGPDGNMVIYDLDNDDLMSPLIDVAADSQVTVTDDKITYWARGDAGTAANCPQYAEYTANGLGAVIATQAVLDIATGEVTNSGETRCSATQ